MLAFRLHRTASSRRVLKDDHRHVKTIHSPKVGWYFGLEIPLDQVTGKYRTRLDLKQTTFDEIMPRIAIIMIPVIKEGGKMPILDKEIFEMNVIMLQWFGRA